MEAGRVIKGVAASWILEMCAWPRWCLCCRVYSIFCGWHSCFSDSLLSCIISSIDHQLCMKKEAERWEDNINRQCWLICQCQWYWHAIHTLLHLSVCLLFFHLFLQPTFTFRVVYAQADGRIDKWSTNQSCCCGLPVLWPLSVHVWGTHLLWTSLHTLAYCISLRWIGVRAGPPTPHHSPKPIKRLLVTRLF